MATATPTAGAKSAPRVLSDILGAARNAARKSVDQLNTTFGGATGERSVALVASSAAATPATVTPTVASATKFSLEGLNNEEKKTLGESRAEMEAIMKLTKTLLGADMKEESHLEDKKAELLETVGKFEQTIDPIMENLREKNRLKGFQSAMNYKVNLTAALEAVLAEVDSELEAKRAADTEQVLGTPRSESYDTEREDQEESRGDSTGGAVGVTVEDQGGARGDNTGGAVRVVMQDERVTQCMRQLQEQTELMKQMQLEQKRQLRERDVKHAREIATLRKEMSEISKAPRKSHSSMNDLGRDVEDLEVMRVRSETNLERVDGKAKRLQFGGTTPARHFVAEGGTRAEEPAQAHENRILRRYGEEIREKPAGELFNPFLVTEEDEGEEFYKILPYPWNVAPPQSQPRTTEFKKLDSLTVMFNGKEDQYPAWRAIFIPAVHQVRCRVGWKATILMRSLDPKAPRLEDIIASIDATPAGYRRAISRLEKMFGNPLGILAARLQEIRKIRTVKLRDYEQQEHLSMKLEDYLDEAVNHGHREELFSPQLYQELQQKLDDGLAAKMIAWCRTNKQQRSPVAIAAWLNDLTDDNRVIASRYAEDPKGVTGKETETENREKKIQRNGKSVAQPRAGADGKVEKKTYGQISLVCPLDNESHKLSSCNKFKDMTATDRWHKVREMKRCFSCFEEGHRTYSCDKGNLCSTCQQKHHTLLHGAEIPPRPARRGPDEVEERALKATTKNAISLQCVPVTCTTQESTRTLEINAIIDTGSSATFLSRRVAEQLGMETYKAGTVTGVDGNRSIMYAAVSQLELKGEDEQEYYIPVYITEDPTSSYKPVDWSSKKDQYEHLEGVRVRPPVRNRTADLIIGMDVPQLVTSLERDKVGRDGTGPFARKTALGWVIGGPAAKEQEKEVDHQQARDEAEEKSSTEAASDIETGSEYVRKERGRRVKKNIIRSQKKASQRSKSEFANRLSGLRKGRREVLFIFEST